MSYEQKNTGLGVSDLDAQTVSLDANWKNRSGSTSPGNAILYYGGSTGTLAYSENAGESWAPITLPDPPNRYCDYPGPTAADLTISQIQTFPGVNGMVTFQARYLASTFWGVLERTFVGKTTDAFADLVSNFEWVYPYEDICSEGCAINFQADDVSGTFYPRGEGDLSRSGQSRVLTALEHPTNGFWYVNFRVGDISTLSRVSSCGGGPAECIGTDGETFDIIIEGATGVANSTAGKCVNDSHSFVWTGGGFSLNTAYTVTACEFLANSAFSITVVIGDTGTL